MSIKKSTEYGGAGGSAKKFYRPLVTHEPLSRLELTILHMGNKLVQGFSRDTRRTESPRILDGSDMDMLHSRQPPYAHKATTGLLAGVK